MKNYRRPLNRSITIGCVLFIIALCMLLSLANLTLYENYVYADYRNYISGILDYTMSHIDGDDLKVCIDTREESEQYRQTLRFMDELMDHFSDIHYFYAILPLNTDETGNMMSVLSAERYYDRYVDTEGNLYLGWISDDEFDSETAAKILEIMWGDGIVYFEEATEWGTDYTGAMPIRDSGGNPIAVLAVDIDISFINRMIMRYATVNICIISVTGAIFIAIFLFWSRRNITKPIKRLEESAVGFVDRCHGQRNVEALSFEAPEIPTDNEIKSLSDAVFRMTEDMRDYVSDIVNAEKHAENMQQLANRDALTGISNKTAYDNEIKRIEDGFGNGNTRVGLAVIDLNFLKTINDTCGHDKGDNAIVQLSRLVCSIFDAASVFRIGGDEFAVILRGDDYDHFEQRLERFEAALERLAADDALMPWEKVSAAVGGARYDAAIDEGMEGLFKRADRIMYERKRAMKANRGN